MPSDREPHDADTREGLPPPFAPDPDLIDHMEDNRRLITRWRAHARQDAAEARARARGTS